MALFQVVFCFVWYFYKLKPAAVHVCAIPKSGFIYVIFQLREKEVKNIFNESHGKPLKEI